ncbi:response regulator [Palleronia sediminis]|uniref:Response regulator n=1 Tax=Palleronia sediminis TaxID=2547833 RepID=A0A4R6A292_9RHOB|nr:response regulator [Palleronia sediminis]TDL76048.1 response regulator [Palleronia sediminis]
MQTDSTGFTLVRRATADRPLLGQTILLVEDSRFAGETMRLMCLSGGARIRRADSLRAATRHLMTYRPSVIVADLGLPDGSGRTLIEAVTGAGGDGPVVLAVSGDPALEPEAMAAGAHGFLAKPIGSIAAFQAAILAHLPADERPRGPRPLPEDRIAVEPGMLDEDLALLADLLDGRPAPAMLGYAVSFARGLGRSCGDAALAAAADALSHALADGRPHGGEFAALVQLVARRTGRDRLAV